MIYDIFLFANELEVLELRMNELKDVVDKFVIFESAETIVGAPKPLYYENNKERFKEFHDKIIHIIYDYPKCDPNAPSYSWNREFSSRDHMKTLLDGLGVKFTKDDILIMGDVDEIPPASTIKNYFVEMGPVTLSQDLFYYKFNCLFIYQSDKWKWLRVLPGNVYNATTPYQIRFAQYPLLNMPGGWHFSFIGNPEFILHKIKASAHQEFNKPEIANIEHITRCIEAPCDIYNRPDCKMKFIDIDETFPKYLRDNVDRYIQLGLIKVKGDQNAVS